ncbi:MAG: hypothetical protein NC428_07590 [Clostridium sp.]|nr:hypothetical protein [Clostridium sp.]
MDEIKPSLPYRAGYGQCKDDFTIEEKELAAFADVFDAMQYVENKYFNAVGDKNIYYLDLWQEKAMQTVRYIYDTKRQKFIEGNELVSGKGDVYVMGYEVSADYYNEEGEYDRTDSSVHMSIKNAEQAEEEHFRYGAMRAVYDEKEISIKKHFWGAEKFLLGTAGIEQEDYHER